MSFEPNYPECEECELYRSGNGESTISRCLMEEGFVEPPAFCPMDMDTEPHPNINEDDWREER